jgi:2-polyprenyl-6-methoxyphenol hydroxylase-like FAD-dependent oxidoreductase
MLDRLGLASEFVQSGVRVDTGLAFFNRAPLGRLRFASCPPPFPFVLSLPQQRTEYLLEERLRRLDARVVTRGAKLTSITQSADHVEAELMTAEGNRSTVRADLLIGCDGKRSLVRALAGIPFAGAAYSDFFTMGDFDDNTMLGPDAAIYLDGEGFVESFPLPDSLRRWVVRAEPQSVEKQPSDIAIDIERRVGVNIRGCRRYMVSAFRAERYLAGRFFLGRVVLAGDAAHVVSPVGGQGLNLGWLGAWRLSEQLQQAIQMGDDLTVALARYEKRQRPAVRRASRRAELNMLLGRPRRRPWLRNGIIRMLLSPGFRGMTARLFTMRGI